MVIYTLVKIHFMFHMQVKNTCMWIKMPKWKLEEKNPNFQICYKGT